LKKTLACDGVDITCIRSVFDGVIFAMFNQITYVIEDKHDYFGKG